MSKLADRIGRLISGGVNAAVEAVEDASPTLIMEQSIREVEEAITEVKAELGRAVAERHQANKKLADLNNKHDELKGQIEVALSKGRDDLASSAISKQMDLEAQIPVVEARITESDEAINELEGYVEALKGKLSEMREELSHFKQNKSEQEGASVIDAVGNPSALNNTNSKIDKAQAAFDRAHSNSDVQGDSKDLNELKTLARDHEIEERLKAFKEGQQKETN